jgi:catecholate siderophore receptor
MGDLAVYAATDGAKVALAQKLPDTRQVAANRSEALPVRRYDIPAGPLEMVLDRFRKTSGASVSVPDTVLLNLESPGVNGVFTSEQALEQLLSGTGLTYSFSDAYRFTIRLKPAVSTVEVNETAPIISSSMPKYQQLLLDTPRPSVSYLKRPCSSRAPRRSATASAM